jgi:hypothetical protein
MWGTTSYSLAYRPKLGFYQDNPKNCKFDIEKMEAWSYGWWLFVARIKGKIVFNDYNYSTQTNAHQSQVKRVLFEHNIEIDMVVDAERGLQDLNGSIKERYHRYFETMILVNRKGTKKARNAERLKEMERLLDQIKDLRYLGGKFSNKEKARMKREYLEREDRRVRELRKNITASDKQLFDSSHFEIRA